MRVFIFFIFLFAVTFWCCQNLQKGDVGKLDAVIHQDSSYHADRVNRGTGEGILLTRFRSFNELKTVVTIKYYKVKPGTFRTIYSRSKVCLTYRCGAFEVKSELKKGISEDDFVTASRGNVWARVRLGMHCPFAVIHRKALENIENLGRRKPFVFGKGDVAFYDLAESMVNHISDEDLMFMPSEDLSEKGYLNTFNHITAQAFMTSIYSEGIADFVADVHERHNLPEMITGDFKTDQVDNLEEGPVDNYLDMINNEWGQELGKVLRLKYQIKYDTYWTPALLSDYLNDVQRYYSWVFRIAFKPFRPDDEIIIRFSGKINLVLNN